MIFSGLYLLNSRNYNNHRAIPVTYFLLLPQFHSFCNSNLTFIKKTYLFRFALIAVCTFKNRKELKYKDRYLRKAKNLYQI